MCAMTRAQSLTFHAEPRVKRAGNRKRCSSPLIALRGYITGNVPSTLISSRPAFAARRTACPVIIHSRNKTHAYCPCYIEKLNVWQFTGASMSSAESGPSFELIGPGKTMSSDTPWALMEPAISPPQMIAKSSVFAMVHSSRRRYVASTRRSDCMSLSYRAVLFFPSDFFASYSHTHVELSRQSFRQR